MANAADLIEEIPARVLLLGTPGSGKTGSLACLANAGFKLRVLAFDKRANMVPLLMYTKPEYRKNIDILFFEDKLRAGQRFIEPIGVPSAFRLAYLAMDHWKYTTGEHEIDLGASRDWGLDTVVVLDSLTAMGQASMRRAMAMANKTPLNRTQQVWGFAMDDQDNFIEKMVGNDNHFHLVVLSHTKMIGPKEVGKDDNDITKAIKTQAADLIVTRFYPNALGRELPQNIARHFPATLFIEKIDKGGKIRRMISASPRMDIDTKLPSIGLPSDLSVESGMVEVFRAMGVKVPPVPNGNSNLQEENIEHE